jgi:hypothetical protein
MSYKELLMDPRWQRKRLEVLEKKGWKCQNCGENETTLNVHHFLYLRGFDPWEYEDWAYAVVCDECHDLAHHYKERRQITLAKSEYARGIIDLLDGLGEEDLKFIAHWLGDFVQEKRKAKENGKVK